MAEFKVAFVNGKVVTYQDDATYEISAEGVLTIEHGEGNLLIFSPSGWLSVEAHKPMSKYENQGVGSV